MNKRTITLREHNEIVTKTILSLDAERTECERQLTEMTKRAEKAEARIELLKEELEEGAA